MSLERLAWLLGPAGAIPAWACAIALWLGWWPGLAGPALLAYVAVILSFLGGIQWGLALAVDADRLRLAVSVVPSLVAWPLLLAPLAPALLALAVALVVWLAVEQRLLASAGYPGWYPRLRLVLTVLLGGAAVAGALA